MENIQDDKADTRIGQLEEWIRHTAKNRAKKRNLKKYKGQYVAHKETLKKRRTWESTIKTIIDNAKNKELSRETLDTLTKEFDRTQKAAQKLGSDELAALITRANIELSSAKDRLDTKERKDKQDALKKSLIQEIIAKIAKLGSAEKEDSEKVVKQLNDKIEELKGLDEAELANNLSRILQLVRSAEDSGSNG